MHTQSTAGLPPFPVHHDVSFRLFCSEADYDAVAALAVVCAVRDRADADSLITRPQAANEVAGLANWLGQPHRRLLLAEAGGTVVGFQLIGEWMNAHGSWQYLHRGLVHPDWRGCGIGTAMLRWAEQELRGLAALHPTDGAAVLAADAGAGPDAAALLAAEGYQEAWRLAELLREGGELPDTLVPAGVRVVPAQLADHVALWRADNAVFGASGDWDLHVPPRFDPAPWCIAWAGQEIVGFCCIERRDSDAAVTVLGVREPWRRRGIARALLAHAIRELEDVSVRTVRTLGDANGGFRSRSLYEQLGFRVVREHVWYRKALGSDRAVFRWPTGERVDVGGRRLHMVRAGDGRPTVIFDAGGDSDSLVWRHVLPRVVTFARVVAYDRAGLGQSEPGPLPRTASSASDDLSALLAAAGIPGPYVLVGHSAGGLNLRLFASRYPSAVAGLVLVDSPHEDMIDAWRSVLPAETWAHLVGPMSYEGGDYVATRAQLAAARPLPDVPLMVLTARHGSYPYGWPREALDAVRVPMQGKLAGLTPQGRQIIVDDTGHEIQRDRPDLVVEAIRHVIAQGRP